MDHEDSKPRKEVNRVTIRFSGDSGDGLQVAGTQLTETSAEVQNDLATLPDFPAEIRAPAGTMAGVSSFQINFSTDTVYTPGDSPDVLVALNPAALKASTSSMPSGTTIIVNKDAFTDRNLSKAGYKSNPLIDDSLSKYRLITIPITTQNEMALKKFSMSPRQSSRSKNFYALGIIYWLYDRPLNHTLEWIQQKWGVDSTITSANSTALNAGYSFADTTELFTTAYSVKAANLPTGKYRNIDGNEALVLGSMVASSLAGIPLFFSGYPITPATTILQRLSEYRDLGVIAFQAEDEIAAIGAAIGASFGGSLSFTATSGPGMALKTESLGLASVLELPLVVINVQRAGPSTGMPTKTEQADLLQAIHGRNGESPVAVLAASTPSDCFTTIIECFRLAVKFMTPVILLSDGYLAHGSEPWKIPDTNNFPPISVKFHSDSTSFKPYSRNPKTLARPWAIPGTPGLEHRIGGLAKEDLTGDVSYDPINNEKMVRLRAQKIANIAAFIPPATVLGDDHGVLLVLGWGSTWGPITAACEQLRQQGVRVSNTHLKHLNPFPSNLGDVLKRFKTVLIPELNTGQLRLLIANSYGVQAIRLSKVQGLPFLVSEIKENILKAMNNT